jgi:hypothetical protein
MCTSEKENTNYNNNNNNNNSIIIYLLMGGCSVVGLATSYGMEDRGVGVRVPVG